MERQPEYKAMPTPKEEGSGQKKEAFKPAAVSKDGSKNRPITKIDREDKPAAEKQKAEKGGFLNKDEKEESKSTGATLTKDKKEPEKKKKERQVSTFGLGEERDFFIENLSMLLSSGMSLISALDTVKDETRNKTMQKIITGIKEDTDAGYPLWKAIERSKLLPNSAVSLIRIGEQTGKLPDNLKVVATQRQKERTFKSKVKSAAMYPVLVFSLTLIIGLGISWFILPKLASLFTNMKLKLPLVTKILILVGKLLQRYGFILVPSIIIGLALLFYFLFLNSKTKFIGQAILFRLPGTKRLILESELARMGYLLNTLLQADVQIVEAIKSVAESTSYRNYKRLYLYLADQVEEGVPINTAFLNFKGSRRLIPISVQQMIVAAEKSGNLSPTFKKISEIYEEKADITTKNLEIIVEPILMVIIWIGVMMVALAVILPIYGMVGSMNKATEQANQAPTNIQNVPAKPAASLKPPSAKPSGSQPPKPAASAAPQSAAPTPGN